MLGLQWDYSLIPATTREGIDGILPEIWKGGGEDLFEPFCGLITKIWNREQMLNDWQRSIICPICKKDD
jgi:hypothetical protein